jgi:hypothetical protein
MTAPLPITLPLDLATPRAIRANALTGLITVVFMPAV